MNLLNGPESFVGTGRIAGMHKRDMGLMGSYRRGGAVQDLCPELVKGGTIILRRKQDAKAVIKPYRRAKPDNKLQQIQLLQVPPDKRQVCDFVFAAKCYMTFY